MNEPFFDKHGDVYQPLPICAGPWDPKSLHGRVVAGLLAAEIERRHGDSALMPARLTVDLYRLPDFSPMRVETQVIRDGRRLRVINAEVFSGDKSAGRASCQMLRVGNEPKGKVWKRDNWSVRSPAEIDAPSSGGLGGMWHTRPISGAMGSDGPRQCWMSEARALIGGEALTPWQRVALAADFASPFANAGNAGLEFINTDITLYLNRLPSTEWIGFEVVNHQSADGVAIGECYLFDEDGPIGSSTVAALAQNVNI
jgi:hypothetical protein